MSAERDMARRLRGIADGLDEVIERYQPEEAAIEDVFVRGNVRSAIVLAQVRGAAMLVASRAGLGVSSYSPAQVKGSVVGYGTASKEQVRQMVQALLALRGPVKPLDASDALAVACCHANLRDFAMRGGQA